MCPSWAGISKKMRKAIERGDMTPEMRHARQVLTPKIDRQQKDEKQAMFNAPTFSHAIIADVDEDEF